MYQEQCTGIYNRHNIRGDPSDKTRRLTMGNQNVNGNSHGFRHMEFILTIGMNGGKNVYRLTLDRFS